MMNVAAGPFRKRTRIGYNFYEIQIGKYLCHIKVDKRKMESNYFILESKDRFIVMINDFENTAAARGLRKLMKQKQSLV
ncbi:MAG: hypothetical protein L6416_11605 [Candidatus Omnitrophica bacterium]|nr:hypothetical protein [Candidatus Omnitrophota bacterium]